MHDPPTLGDPFRLPLGKLPKPSAQLSHLHFHCRVAIAAELLLTYRFNVSHKKCRISPNPSTPQVSAQNPASRHEPACQIGARPVLGPRRPTAQAAIRVASRNGKDKPDNLETLSHLTTRSASPVAEVSGPPATIDRSHRPMVADRDWQRTSFIRVEKQPHTMRHRLRSVANANRLGTSGSSSIDRRPTINCSDSREATKTLNA